MPQDWEPKDWVEAHASRVARQITALRGKRSAQWLSDETEKWGYRVARATIADLENGRRRHVTTAEVAVLAAALNTAPIALMYGPDYGAVIEVLPGTPVQKIEAAQWFSGIRDHGFSGAVGAEQARVRNEYRENLRELNLWQELWDIERKIFAVTERDLNSAGSRAQLSTWHDREHWLRGQLGLEELD